MNPGGMTSIGDPKIRGSGGIAIYDCRVSLLNSEQYHP